MPLSSKTKREAFGKDLDNSQIVATSQQSRFHDIDRPTSNDIDLQDLTVSIGGRDVVENVHLQLKGGGRYALVGRNGLGKSTIMKALAEKRIPGVSAHLRILLLGQTSSSRDEKDVAEDTNTSLIVLEHVIKSDERREILVNESKLLSTALETRLNAPERINKAVKEVKLGRVRRDLHIARLVASRRSGARGAKARQVLIEKENLLEEAEVQLNEAVDMERVQQDINTAVAMLEDLQIDLEGLDVASTEARARSILVGLGFSEEQIVGPLHKLSGGWQTRASLAAALVQQTDILLLDEPTNFLDLPAVIWLQNYLSVTLSASTTLLVTTHDRDFADAVADHLLILRVTPPKSIETFKGSLTDYFAEKRRQIRRMTKMAEAIERKSEHMKATVIKSVSAARKTGDDKKLKVAASRKKKLEERTGMEVNSKGNRFKLNRDRVGFFGNGTRAQAEIPEFDPPIAISFLSQPSSLRNTSSLVSLEDVCFTYPKTKRQILDNITLTIQLGSRTGLVGLNGSGKSTLVNLITSSSPTCTISSEILKASSGTVILHPTARIAHYTQHHPTTLASLTTTSSDGSPWTPLTYLTSLHPDLPEQTLRATLSGLALASTHHTIPLSSLSGGQLVRVSLATLLLPTAPHLLILDEPTTHLDSETILGLIAALKRYEGAILIVSHDRFFVRCVVEGQSAHQGRVDVEEGDMSSDDESGDSSGSGNDDRKNNSRLRVQRKERLPSTVYRMTKTGKMFRLERGMDQYEELIVKQLMKNRIDV